MNIVFTMAGTYSRFKLFGAQVPKYLLPLGQSTILAKVLDEIKQACAGSKFYFIANRNDQLFYPILKSILQKYKVPENNLIYVDNTNSQLETATYAADLIQNQQNQYPICFANIDTIAMNRHLFFEKLSKIPAHAAFLDTFDGRSAKYSYVRSSDENLVLEVVDNNIVSDFACSGLYGFGSFSTMLEFTQELLVENKNANFTSLYNFYIDKGEVVSHLPAGGLQNTVVLGSPEEYVINIHRFSQ